MIECINIENEAVDISNDYKNVGPDIIIETIHSEKSVVNDSMSSKIILNNN